VGYLTSDVRARRNLALLPRTYVTHIQFTGKRASGVSVRLSDGSQKTIKARTVIVAAGSLHTPALLMRAGIGPAEHLQELGISVIADLPGVGANLQDHPTLAVAAHIKRSAVQARSWRPAPNVSLRYSSGHQGCAPHDCWLSIANKTSWHPLGRRIAALGVSVYKPYSRGFVRLISPSPMAEPHVEFRMLSDPRDLARMKIGFRKATEIMRTPKVAALTNEGFAASFSERVRDLNRVTRRNWTRSLAGTIALDGPGPIRRWLIETVVAPNAALDPILRDDEALESWILANTAGFYHPVGTCKMGAAADRTAVADSGGKVHGLENLYVADASLMPTIVRGNTNIPTIMIAEKISDELKKAVRPSLLIREVVRET
jgi:5-(hydroxymethyl)furfural/furfural oxidase